MTPLRYLFQTNSLKWPPWLSRLPKYTPGWTKTSKTEKKGVPEGSFWEPWCSFFDPRNELVSYLLLCPSDAETDIVRKSVRCVRKGNAHGSRDLLSLLQRHSWQFCSSATHPICFQNSDFDTVLDVPEIWMARWRSVRAALLDNLKEIKIVNRN